MTTTAEARRAYSGPALFSIGLRPFFLGSAVWAALAVPIWIWSWAHGDGTVGGVDGRLWHLDEMLFGFLPGVIAGFLLTAVPNWTGRLPVLGAELAMLFGLWFSGRVANLFAGPLGWAAVIVDLAFLFVLAAVIGREVLAGKARKNLPVVVLVTLLAVAHLLSHLAPLAPALGESPKRLAVAVGAGLVALIGGRITPSFTRNWLVKRGVPATASAEMGPLDKAALLATGVSLTAWVVAPAQPIVGGGLVAAGLLTFARLARWQGLKTGAEALVWILHAGYAWLAAGLVLLGLGVFAPAAVPQSAGVHALTAGAFGVMILAVMTRAGLGHTGRDLHANGAVRVIYALVLAGAVARTAAPLLGDWYGVLVGVSAALWAAAFAGYATLYAPVLWRPRPDGRS